MLALFKSAFSHAFTTAITVCVTIIVTLWLNGPSGGPVPTVEMRWVDLPQVDVSVAGSKDWEIANPVLTKLFGTDRVPGVVNDMRYGTAPLVIVKVSNRSSQRTKAMEVIGDKIAIAVVQPPGGKAAVTSATTPIRLQPLLPGEETKVWLLLTSGATLDWATPVRVLHDGTLISPTFGTLRNRDDEFGLISFLLRISPWAELYLLSSATLLIFFTAYGIWFALNRHNLPLMARVTAASELGRAAALVDYVRREQPDKLPAEFRTAPTASTTPTST